MTNEKEIITIYTDGACLGNPGPGGWGAVLKFQGRRKELSGGFRNTTNNRMEMFAVIQALECLQRPSAVEVFTDSRYLHDAVQKGWLSKWRRNGWQTAAREPVKNRDLWLRLDKLLREHRVRFVWIRGHAGDPENEFCDKLAGQAALMPGLPEDEPYARGQ